MHLVETLRAAPAGGKQGRGSAMTCRHALVPKGWHLRQRHEAKLQSPELSQLMDQEFWQEFFFDGVKLWGVCLR